MNYTKGKWYLQKYTDAYTNIVRCDNGKGFETLFIAATPQGGVNARDNALLMSKSPEMLEALKDELEFLDIVYLSIDYPGAQHLEYVRHDINARKKQIETLLKKLE